MLERLIRTAAVLASLVVVVSFGCFAAEEARSASDQSATGIEGRAASRVADPSPEQERAREAAHTAPREAVDDVDDVLLSPFASVAGGSESRWLRRSVPALIALLVYGLGLGFLARFAAGR